jgi:muramoyltetrapeptide carboxypeptidase LdcA involved in peptidoglycan recycling
MAHRVAYFEERGYRVTVGTNALASFGFLADPAAARAADFNAMLRDPHRANGRPLDGRQRRTASDSAFR